MHFVRGVAGLLRKTGQERNSSAEAHTQVEVSLPPSWPNVEFSSHGDEEVLKCLWQGYQDASVQEEAQKALKTFLEKFIDVFQHWVPSERSFAISEVGADREDINLIGCSFGHPTRVIVGLVKELKDLIKIFSVKSDAENDDTLLRYGNAIDAGLRLLNAITIITRSSHNRLVFRNFGGLQTLTGILKAAVIHLKAVASTISVDNNPTSSTSMVLSYLQCFLAHVVSVLANFIGTNSQNGKVGGGSNDLQGDTCFSNIGTIENWRSGDHHQRHSLNEGGMHESPVLLLETGGLNWFVELVRVLRRLRLKGTILDPSLEKLALRTLRTAIGSDSRTQNHFRSIGGLEALMDGIGNSFRLTISSPYGQQLDFEELWAEFEIQVLSLEAIREAAFKNVSSLQTLRDIGGVKKFVKIIHWAAFSFPALCPVSSSTHDDGSPGVSMLEVHDYTHPLYNDNLQGWNSKVAPLCRILCSFLVPSGDISSFTGELLGDQDAFGSYWEIATRWIINVLLGVFHKENFGNLNARLSSSTLQHYVLHVLKKMLLISPAVLQWFREEDVWDIMFSDYFFYFGVAGAQAIVNDGNGTCQRQANTVDIEPLRLEVVSFVELAATTNGGTDNTAECEALIQALEKCSSIPTVVTMLLKSLHRILQLSTDATSTSFQKLKFLDVLAQVMRTLKAVGVPTDNLQLENSHQARDSAFDLFDEYLVASDRAKPEALCNLKLADALFQLLQDDVSRKFSLRHIIDLMKLPPVSEQEQDAKMELCIKYLEFLSQSQTSYYANGMEMLLDLIIGIRDILDADLSYYQALFREGECFVHIVSLLNVNYMQKDRQKLGIEVIVTLTHLLKGNEASKIAFRSLVGPGYRMLQTLLNECYQSQPKHGLVDALLDMLVDGHFNISSNMVLQNEDAIILFFNMVRQCDQKSQDNALDIFHRLLEESTANQAACVRAGLLELLLDWFAHGKQDGLLMVKITQLMQLTGGHNITGKEMRKMFLLLRSTTADPEASRGALLMSAFKGMLRERGPVAFFELSGRDSGIAVTSSLRWPNNKGFTFCCWARFVHLPVSSNEQNEGMISLFSFLSENGKGCNCLLSKNCIVIESAGHKRETVSVKVSLKLRKWHLICITHSAARALSAGNTLKVYVDGFLVGNEKLRYPKIMEQLTRCTIGASSPYIEEGNEPRLFTIPLCGQLGAIYFFHEAIGLSHVQGIYSLGADYIYSSSQLGHSAVLVTDTVFSKEGLASKMTFGYNAQASSGRCLYDVSPAMEPKELHEARIMGDTQLCYRRLVQDIVHCIGGIGVFFPLLLQLEGCQTETSELDATDILNDKQDTKGSRLIVDVVELLIEFVTGNFANQQTLQNSAGISILGLLLEFVPPEHISVKVVSALNALVGILEEGSDAGLSEALVQEAISQIYLNPRLWSRTHYMVQRKVLLSLMDFCQTKTFCSDGFLGLSRFLDIIQEYYLEAPKKRSMKLKITNEELSQLRILLLVSAESSLRDRVTVADLNSLFAFIEQGNDLGGTADVLQMLLGLLCQKDFLSNFFACLCKIGGIHLFVGLLKRQQEVLRLLGLYIISLLIIGVPVESKGNRLFNIGWGSTAEVAPGSSQKFGPVFSVMTESLLIFPFTELLQKTLFDILLGGNIPKQILERGIISQYGKSQNERGWLPQLQQSDEESALPLPQFTLPQVLGIILKFVSLPSQANMRSSILNKVFLLLKSNPMNCQILAQEPAWQDWFLALMSKMQCETGLHKDDETILLRKIFSTIHCHSTLNVRGGWRHVERTMNFIVMYDAKGLLPKFSLQPQLLEDLVEEVLHLQTTQAALATQPCRDNVLYLLALLDEVSIWDTSHFLPSFEDGQQEDMQDGSLLSEGFVDLGVTMLSPSRRKSLALGDGKENRSWKLYRSVWELLSRMHGKGCIGDPSSAAPSFGQRARGLVESFNVPAAEMAAAVVSGSLGISTSNKLVDKAIKLRGEKWPRIGFRLVLLYLYEADLEETLHCIQQFLSLLPHFLCADSEQTRNRLHLLLWCLTEARSNVGNRDAGARFHIISQVIHECLHVGKGLLATSIAEKERSTGRMDRSMPSVSSLVQQERVSAAVEEEKKYLKSFVEQRNVEVECLTNELSEMHVTTSQEGKQLEDQSQSLITAISIQDNCRITSIKINNEDDKQALTDRWCLMYRNLSNERGPWSSSATSILRWKLDKCEDPYRCRLKLRRNYHFDESLLYPSEVPNSKSDSLFSLDNIKNKMKLFSIKGVQQAVEEIEYEFDEKPNEGSSESACTELSQSNNIPQDKTQAISQSTALSNKTDIEVVASVPCVLVAPRRKLAGHLEITQLSLQFHVEFLVEGTAGSMIFSSIKDKENNSENLCPAKDGGWNMEMDINSISCSSDAEKKIKRRRQWDISQIVAVHGTRYLLQHTALEIFFGSSIPPVFFNFSSAKVAKDVAMKILSCRNATPNYRKSTGREADNLNFVDRWKAIEMAERAKDAWRRRETSNFEYLMVLNTLAGRSYNDITQYPVFPWILADYSSEVLDLKSCTSFRELSKPVGALNSQRFKVFEDRYHNFSDPEIPSFYYGSHYSSMGNVLFYLLRLEPFSSLHRNLQGGKFDHADRLFHSIESAYANCLTNTSDVKELIPEFFYMPEFLVNTNEYFIGVRQDGQHIGDVVLPPWAKGSPDEFVKLHREALESEYVSDHLHEWIDLIFGYKQKGRPAVDAANIFYYLTYEGAVDLEALENDHQRSAVEDQIANFGQTPMQLFRKKHPKRGPAVPLSRPLYYAPGSIILSSTTSCSVTHGRNSENSSLAFLAITDGKIVLITNELAVSVRLWLTPPLQGGGSFTFSSSQDSFYGIGPELSTTYKVGGYWAENMDVTSNCFELLQSSFLVTCGHWDHSFKVLSLGDGQILQSNCQHKDVVTCVSVAVDGSLIATGSRDTTVIVWEVEPTGLSVNTRRSTDKQGKQELIVSNKPRHVLCGHDDAVTCVAVRVELDLMISGSKDGTCIFHALRKGRYVRSLRHPNGNSISQLLLSQHGIVIVFSNDDLILRLFTVNGRMLNTAESNGRLNSLSLSSCGNFVFCGGDQGQIIMRSMQSLEVVQRYDGTGGTITCLTVSPEDCFLAGTKDGSILVFSVDSSHRKSSR